MWVPETGLPGQVGQESGGDGVELADIPEGRRSEEGSQGRGCVDPVEQGAPPTVAYRAHINDGVSVGDHPTDQEVIFAQRLHLCRSVCSTGPGLGGAGPRCRPVP